MKFSVVLIAKNEAKTLPRLKASLQEFLDRGGEVVLVDTGSTDGTAELARGFGFKVTEAGERFIRVIDKDLAEKMNARFIVGNEPPVVKEGDKLFDYAGARNFAATLSSNDMIATPDPDEAYSRLDLDRVNAAIENGAEQLEYQFVFSHDAFGQPVIQFLHCKFYNRTKMKWVGIVHEVLQGEAKRQYLDESIIKLEHWQQPAEHRSRYLTGLALDCYLNPDNDRNSHYFGRELLWNGRPKSAIRELARHIGMNKWPAERAQSMVYVGEAYGALNEPARQVEWFSKAFYFDSQRREPLIKLARFYEHNKNPQAAACYAAAALEIPWGDFYANTKSHYTYEPHEILYNAKGFLGDIEAAKYHILKALSYQPLSSKYLHDYRYYFGLPKISVVLPTLGRPAGLKRCLDSIKNLNYPENLIELIVLEDDPRIGVPFRVKQGVARSTGEYIVFASNDIEFTPDSFMLAYLKNKGLVAFNNGFVLPDEGNICEHFMIRKDLIPKIGGEIFDTAFHHVGVDNLLWAKCKKLGEAVRADDAIVKHYHFSKGGKMDEVYDEGWRKSKSDRKLLKKKLQELEVCPT